MLYEADVDCIVVVLCCVRVYLFFIVRVCVTGLVFPFVSVLNGLFLCYWFCFCDCLDVIDSFVLYVLLFGLYYLFVIKEFVLLCLSRWFRFDYVACLLALCFICVMLYEADVDCIVVVLCCVRVYLFFIVRVCVTGLVFPFVSVLNGLFLCYWFCFCDCLDVIDSFVLYVLLFGLYYLFVIKEFVLLCLSRWFRFDYVACLLVRVLFVFVCCCFVSFCLFDSLVLLLCGHEFLMLVFAVCVALVCVVFVVVVVRFVRGVAFVLLCCVCSGVDVVCSRRCCLLFIVFM